MEKNKTGMRAAWLLILCAAFAVLGGSVLGKFGKTLGADKYVARILCQVLLIVPAVAGAIYVSCVSGKRYAAKDMGFNRFHPALVFILLILPACSRYFGIYIQSFGAEFSVETFSVQKSTIPYDRYDMIMLFLSNCIIAPLLEETIFRGAVYKCVEPYGSVRAVFVSALGFALIHFQPTVFVSLFVWGLVLGLVRNWSGSVIACILFHSWLNFETFIHSVFVAELYYITDFLMGYAAVMAHLFPVVLLITYLCFGRGKSVKKYTRSGGGGVIPMLCVFALYGIIVYLKGM